MVWAASAGLSHLGKSPMTPPLPSSCCSFWVTSLPWSFLLLFPGKRPSSDVKFPHRQTIIKAFISIFLFNMSLCVRWTKYTCLGWYWNPLETYSVCLSVCLCTLQSVHMCTICVQVPAEARKGYQIPKTGVTSSCELPHVCAENQTWILHKSGKCSQLLSHPLISLKHFRCQDIVCVQSINNEER